MTIEEAIKAFKATGCRCVVVEALDFGLFIPADALVGLDEDDVVIGERDGQAVGCLTVREVRTGCDYYPGTAAN